MSSESSTSVGVDDGSGGGDDDGEDARERLLLEGVAPRRTDGPNDALTAAHLRIIIDVATTGAYVHPWPLLRVLLVRRLDEVVHRFKREDERRAGDRRAPSEACRRVVTLGVAEADVRLEACVAQLEAFRGSGGPFTLQRLCEVLGHPHAVFRHTHKLLNAVERLLGVTETVAPVVFRQRQPAAADGAVGAAAALPATTPFHLRPATPEFDTYEALWQPLPSSTPRPSSLASAAAAHAGSAAAAEYDAAAAAAAHASVWGSVVSDSERHRGSSSGGGAADAPFGAADAPFGADGADSSRPAHTPGGGTARSPADSARLIAELLASAPVQQQQQRHEGAPSANQFADAELRQRNGGPSPPRGGGAHGGDVPPSGGGGGGGGGGNEGAWMDVELGGTDADADVRLGFGGEGGGGGGGLAAAAASAHGGGALPSLSRGGARVVGEWMGRDRAIDFPRTALPHDAEAVAFDVDATSSGVAPTLHSAGDGYPVGTAGVGDRGGLDGEALEDETAGQHDIFADAPQQQQHVAATETAAAARRDWSDTGGGGGEDDIFADSPSLTRPLAPRAAPPHAPSSAGGATDRDTSGWFVVAHGTAAATTAAAAGPGTTCAAAPAVPAAAPPAVAPAAPAPSGAGRRPRDGDATDAVTLAKRARASPGLPSAAAAAPQRLGSSKPLVDFAIDSDDDDDDEEAEGEADSCGPAEAAAAPPFALAGIMARLQAGVRAVTGMLRD